MTKCKSKLLKFGIICLMPLFALLLCLNNTYAWYVDDNNNLTSSNYADLSNLNSIQAINAYNYSVSGQVLTITQNSSTTDPYIYFNDFITLEAGSYSIYYLVDTMQVQYLGLTTNNTTNIVHSIPYQNYSRITIAQTTTFGFGFEGNGALNREFNIRIMIYSENYQLDYEPYGMSYINPQNIDFMEYLLGTNYFSHGRVFAYQTNDNNYWNRRIYPNANLVISSQIAGDTINQYINGNVLNLGTLSVALMDDLSSKSNYNISNFTAIALKPALAINGTATYPPVECRYIDLYIYCPNVITTASCLVGGISDIDYDNHRRVDFTKEGDYIHITFDENSYDYIWDIDIKLTYSSGWVYPQSVRCDLENAPIYSTYDLGVESGYQKGLVEGKQSGYNQGKIDGYNWGFEYGKSVGYSEGINSNLETNGFKTLLNSIISYPINLVKNSLDFNFMGINVAQIVMFIISLGIVAFVIQKFKE